VKCGKLRAGVAAGDGGAAGAAGIAAAAAAPVYACHTSQTTRQLAIMSASGRYPRSCLGTKLLAPNDLDGAVETAHLLAAGAPEKSMQQLEYQTMRFGWAGSITKYIYMRVEIIDNLVKDRAADSSWQIPQELSALAPSSWHRTTSTKCRSQTCIPVVGRGSRSLQ
jgi:hypothetical protein